MEDPVDAGVDAHSPCIRIVLNEAIELEVRGGVEAGPNAKEALVEISNGKSPDVMSGNEFKVQQTGRIQVQTGLQFVQLTTVKGTEPPAQLTV